MKTNLTTAQKIYRTILDGSHGRDAEFIANVILTSACKPTTKLRNLLALLVGGKTVTCGNSIDSLRVDGDYRYLTSLD